MRFGYDGTAFHGWARQPGLRTVEGELRRGLSGLAVTTPANVATLEVASRTDRGVSARANALSVASPLAGRELLRRLNGVDPSLFFTAATVIGTEFRVRRAIRRTYRYYDHGPLHDEGRVLEAAALFTGEIDARSFGRGIPAGVPSMRSVESVTVHPLPGGSLIEVRAPSFVWGMVRKIVGTLREVDAGRLSIPRLRSALAGGVRLTLPMAEPEPLVLWEVEFGIPWEVRWEGPTRAQGVVARGQREAWWVRGRLHESLYEDVAVSRSPR